MAAGRDRVQHFTLYLPVSRWGHRFHICSLFNHFLTSFSHFPPVHAPRCDSQVVVACVSVIGKLLLFITSAVALTEKQLGRPMQLQVSDCVLAPCPLQGDKELSVKGEDGRLYHWILPSFFQLLRDLSQEGREFAVLFRTFGTDLPRVLRAVSRALDGAHPLFPDLPQLKVTWGYTQL